MSTFPLAKEDVALVVDDAVPAAAVEAALREGAGDLLESVRLFDVYTGPQVGEGRKSLAFALRLRAPDRTLTAAESSAVRDAAVRAAVTLVGASPARSVTRRPVAAGVSLPIVSLRDERVVRMPGCGHPGSRCVSRRPVSGRRWLAGCARWPSG